MNILSIKGLVYKVTKNVITMVSNEESKEKNIGVGGKVQAKVG